MLLDMLLNLVGILTTIET